MNAQQKSVTPAGIACGVPNRIQLKVDFLSHSYRHERLTAKDQRCNTPLINFAGDYHIRAKVQGALDLGNWIDPLYAEPQGPKQSHEKQSERKPRPLSTPMTESPRSTKRSAK